MMLKSLFITLILCISVILGQYNCYQSCTTVETTNECPSNSVCRNIANSAQDTELSCVCNSDCRSVCTASIEGSVQMSCNCSAPTNPGCGPDFPTGCPEGSHCVQSTNADTPTCACEHGMQFNDDRTKCVSVCPDHSTPSSSGGCQCDSGYTASTIDGRFACSPSSCSSDSCPSGYHCIQATSGPTCEKDESNTVPTCNSNFHCPDDVHWDCIDTSTGPHCICSGDYAGYDCSKYACWTVNDILGCWWANAHAACVTDSTGSSYCVCTDSYTGDTCTVPDDQCTTHNCDATRNLVCHEGECVCKSGYAPALTSTGDEECVPVHSSSECTTTCEGNTVCARINNEYDCVCPANTFGSHDCSKPRCHVDSDCQSPNAYCVVSVKPGVGSFCQCKPGFTGDDCLTDVSTCNCDENRECDNEGGCRCPTHATGSNCDQTTQEVCQELIVVLDGTGTIPSEDEIRAAITRIARIDVTNIRIEGPTDDHEHKRYHVWICADADVDEKAAAEAFLDHVESGNTEGLNIVSAKYADDGSGAASISVIFVLTVTLTLLAILF